ncbi:MAG: hypothetical protein NVSMB66_3750 [Candidatus Doudnabacteria bacterium]
MKKQLDDIKKVRKFQSSKILPPLFQKSTKPLNESSFTLQPTIYIEEKEATRVRSSKKTAFITGLAVLAFSGAIYFGARLVSFASSVSTSQGNFFGAIRDNIGATFGPLIPKLKSLDSTQLAEDIKNKKRINILILGYGGEGHDGAFLTDTMLLLSIDTENNKLSYLPIPRDLWIKIPTKGYDGSYAKINAAYPIGMDAAHYPYKLSQFSGIEGGGNLSKYAVSEVIGQPVDYYASFDFFAFKKIVDSLGGVEVDVQNSFTDYTFPSSDLNANGPLCSAEDSASSNSICRYKKIHFDQGPQLMSGDRALDYARSRHALGTEGSDFSRSKRQQRLVSAIERKSFSAGGLVNVLGWMDSIQGHLKTNLSLAEVKDLYDYAGKLNIDTADHLSLTEPDQKLLTPSISVDGQWTLLPVSASISDSFDVDGAGEDWSAIHKYVSDKLQ